MIDRLTTPILIAAALGAAGTPAAADIFRGCRGWVQVTTERAGSLRLAELDASGRCDNRGQANLCRDRAQRRITSCADALVNDMDAAALPWQCTSEFRSDTRVNWFFWGGIDDVPYPGGSPSGYDRVARHACCRPQTHMEVVDVAFFSEATGDPGCYERRRVIGTTFVGIPPILEVNCAAEVARGICGPVEGPIEGPPVPPTRTNQPTRTNPTPPPPPENAGGSGDLRLGD